VGASVDPRIINSPDCASPTGYYFSAPNGSISLDELIREVDHATPQAWNFAIDPKDMMKYLKVVKKLFCKIHPESLIILHVSRTNISLSYRQNPL
jgi:hypothetical protein